MDSSKERKKLGKGLSADGDDLGDAFGALGGRRLAAHEVA